MTVDWETERRDWSTASHDPGLVELATTYDKAFTRHCRVLDLTHRLGVAGDYIETAAGHVMGFNRVSEEFRSALQATNLPTFAVGERPDLALTSQAILVKVAERRRAEQRAREGHEG